MNVITVATRYTENLIILSRKKVIKRSEKMIRLYIVNLIKMLLIGSSLIYSDLVVHILIPAFGNLRHTYWPQS